MGLPGSPPRLALLPPLPLASPGLLPLPASLHGAESAPYGRGDILSSPGTDLDPLLEPPRWCVANKLSSVPRVASERGSDTDRPRSGAEGRRGVGGREVRVSYILLPGISARAHHLVGGSLGESVRDRPKTLAACIA